MPSLAETQRLMRHAVVTGEATDIEPLLTGGRYVAQRLAIHHRHYATSLVTALLGKYPATAWLVGAPFVMEAARHFVRAHPPSVPCVAEYGEAFPHFLSTLPSADRVPYLRPFACAEWHVGHVSVAIDHPAATWAELARNSADALPDMKLSLQPGIRYVRADWPVDHLMSLYLTDTAPEHLSLEPAEVRLEIRGARGEFTFKRLEGGDFTFRMAIADGVAIGGATEAALAVQASFDPGGALVALVSEGAVRQS